MLSTVNRRAKLTGILGKSALKSFHPGLLNIRHLVGEFWSDNNEHEAEPLYQRQIQIAPKLGEFKVLLTKWLEAEALLSRRQRRTAVRLYEGLVDEGYTGAYDSVRRFVKQWKASYKNTPLLKQAFVPLVFKPGEVCQFDWSREVVEIGGIEQAIKAAHFRLAYSRKMF